MTQIIHLTKNKIVYVDDDDYEYLCKFNWYAQGLEGRAARRITVPRRTIIYIYHQILRVWPWELRVKGLVIDHINRNVADNTKTNLRICTQVQNMLNSKTSLLRKGVGRDNTHNTWKAYLDKPNAPRVNIGTFKTREEAERAVAEYN